MSFLDRIPLVPLAIAAVLLGLAPFIPEPHLWQKAKMLWAGTLTQPADIFDVFFHGGLLVLLGLKVARGFGWGVAVPEDMPETYDEGSSSEMES